MPMLNTPKKFVIRQSDVSGKYEIEASKATPTSDSTKQLSSWYDQAATGKEPIRLLSHESPLYYRSQLVNVCVFGQWS